jgi:hypothetical protein
VLEIGAKPNRINHMMLADPIVRNDEVVGSIPTSSTNLLNHLATIAAISLSIEKATYWAVMDRESLANSESCSSARVAPKVRSARKSPSWSKCVSGASGLTPISGRLPLEPTMSHARYAGIASSHVVPAFWLLASGRDRSWSRGLA